MFVYKVTGFTYNSLREAVSKLLALNCWPNTSRTIYAAKSSGWVVLMTERLGIKLNYLSTTASSEAAIIIRYGNNISWEFFAINNQI